MFLLSQKNLSSSGKSRKPSYHKDTIKQTHKAPVSHPLSRKAEHLNWACRKPVERLLALWNVATRGSYIEEKKGEKDEDWQVIMTKTCSKSPDIIRESFLENLMCIYTFQSTIVIS